MIEKSLAGMLWLARGTSMVLGLSIILAVVLGAATTALAAMPGDPFKLGQVNTIDRISQLVGTTTNAMLRVDNNGTGPALSLESSARRPPLIVNADAGTARNLSADRLDGRDSTDFARAYKRTVVVSPVGTPAQNGTALKNALNGITGASASNPFLLKIEPGVYNVGNSDTSLGMKSYVDVEGSGEGVTTITASGNLFERAGTVIGASNSELRSLTVRNTGGNGTDYANAIYNEANGFRMKHMTASASGAGNNTGVKLFQDGDATLSQVTVNASGTAGSFPNVIGVHIGGDATLSQVNISASGTSSSTGIVNAGGTTQVRDSRIEGDTTMTEILASSTTLVGASQLAGGPVNAGDPTCAGVYDENYAFFASTCP